ncbi:hypothetical protein FOA52_008051 [Chlamydomonas sp. UWO 241]|nr:hypothetical protein FOA52_008051 [Chlamydomonas sp. UWO 241]
MRCAAAAPSSRVGITARGHAIACIRPWRAVCRAGGFFPPYVPYEEREPEEEPAHEAGGNGTFTQQREGEMFVHEPEPDQSSSAPSVLFNDAFTEALLSAIDRDPTAGEQLACSTSLKQPSKVSEEPETSATVEALTNALRTTRYSLERLELLQLELTRGIERERLQVERLEFALEKAVKDEAYYKVLRRLQPMGGMAGNSDWE